MAIVPVKKTLYPKRQWALASFADTGKSTFAASLRHPLLVTDSDDRFAESAMLLGLPESSVLMISDKRADHTDVLAISEALAGARKSGMKIGTLVVDSLTGIIQPVVTAAMQAELKKRGAAMMEKASAMRNLIDAVQNFGGDYLLIWHHENRGDNTGEARIHETVPPTERDALTRALNMELATVKERIKDGGYRYGIHVVWARYGDFGMTVWDEPNNFFRGMPEKIEKAVYSKGVNVAPKPQPATPAAASAPVTATPATASVQPAPATVTKTDPVAPVTQQRTVQATFKDKADALNWSVAQGAYPAYADASIAYGSLKESLKPENAEQMFKGWKMHVTELIANRQPAEVGAGW